MPPRIPYVDPATVTDPELQVDVVAGSPRAVERAPVLSNSFGFGGHNAALVLGPGG